MLVKFVGYDTEGTTYESNDLQSREDIAKVDNMVQKLLVDEEFSLKNNTEEEIVMEAFKRCGFSAKKVNVISILM